MADSTAASFTDDGGFHSHEWLQLHEQFLPEDNMFSTYKGSGSSTSSSCLLSPYDENAVGFSPKPVRKGRGPKKMPTTLLKANVRDFRALVQKFTGCPKRSSPSSFNLDFQLGKIQSEHGSNCQTPCNEDVNHMSWSQHAPMDLQDKAFVMSSVDYDRASSNVRMIPGFDEFSIPQ